MLSGVGPADHLKSKHIEVKADVPGVGKNLRDHPAVTVMADINEPISITDQVLKEGSGAVNKLVSACGLLLLRGRSALRRLTVGTLYIHSLSCTTILPPLAPASLHYRNRCRRISHAMTTSKERQKQVSEMCSTVFFKLIALTVVDILSKRWDVIPLLQTALRWLLTGTGPLTSPGCENGAFYRSAKEKNKPDIQASGARENQKEICVAFLGVFSLV